MQVRAVSSHRLQQSLHAVCLHGIAKCVFRRHSDSQILHCRPASPKWSNESADTVPPPDPRSVDATSLGIDCVDGQALGPRSRIGGGPLPSPSSARAELPWEPMPPLPPSKALPPPVKSRRCAMCLRPASPTDTSDMLLRTGTAQPGRLVTLSFVLGVSSLSRSSSPRRSAKATPWGSSLVCAACGSRQLHERPCATRCHTSASCSTTLMASLSEALPRVLLLLREF